MGHDDGNKFKASSKIMLASIIYLFLVMILFIILYFYAIYLRKRQERRRGASLYPLTIGVALAEATSSKPLKTGLDESVMASLPVFIYRPTDRLNHDEAIDCLVCLSVIVEEAMVRLLPNCKHLFHAECIDIWLSSHTTCPICRTGAKPRLHQEHSKVGTAVQPTAPPLEQSTQDGAVQLETIGGSGSLISPFQRMLSRERSLRTIRSCGEVGAEDLERL